MKAKSSLLLAVILCMVCAAPAFAQSQKTEQTLQTILARHPKLAANPSLVNDPNWQQRHPDAYAWFRHHPKALEQTRAMGAWEPNGTWHEPDWWYRNNPNWVYQNRPDWIERNPSWRERGDWDDAHEWHDRDWYWQNRREWVAQHHPEWTKKEEKRLEKEEKREEKAEHGPPYGKAVGHHHHEHKHDND